MKLRSYSYLSLVVALAVAQAADAQNSGGANANPATAPTAPSTPMGSNSLPAAATATSDANPGGEIIVTAQKRSETLTSVPMSISAVSGEKLQQTGITSVADLTKIVPGLAYQPSDYGSPIITLRGVGLRNIAIADSPTVSVYVDQVPLPFSEMTRGATLDLERVEVLKGPQGTLFGQNSTGGAINYIAAKPTDKFEGNAALTYGRFNEVDGEVELSGPLSDTLKARVAVRTEQRDGWQESETRDDTLGSRNFTTGRLIVDWQPADALKISVNVNGWLDKSETPASQFVGFSASIPDGRQTLVPYITSLTPTPDKARLADWDPGVDFHRDDHLVQGSLRADWSIASDTTLTSITSYSSFREDAPIDTDGTAVDDYRLTINGKIDTVTQELRLAGAALDQKLKWVVGGNYESDITKDDQLGQFQATDSGIAGATFDGFVNSNHSNIKSYAAFASADFSFTRTLTLQGSIRYTHSDIDFRGCLRDDGTGQIANAFSRLAGGTPIAPGACVTLDPNTFQPVPIVASSLKEHNIPWRVGLSYKPTRASNFYFNVTQGYKAGSYPTVPGFFPAEFAPVKQESLLAYEVGFKQSFFGGKVRASGAAFYYNYKNKQLLGYINTAFGNLPALISIPKGDIKGAELQFDLRPVRGLTLSLGGTYVKSRVKSNFIGNDPIGDPVNFRGEAFPGTPKWQYTLDGQYDFPVSGPIKAFVGGTASYRSSAQAAFGELPVYKIKGYTLIDLRAGIDDGPWRLQVFGHNITNKFYVNNVSHVTDTIARTVGMPATYGVTIARKF